MGEKGLGFFFGVALIVLIAGASIFGIVKANNSQQDAANKIESVSSDIWDEAMQAAGK